MAAVGSYIWMGCADGTVLVFSSLDSVPHLEAEWKIGLPDMESVPSSRHYIRQILGVPVPVPSSTTLSPLSLSASREFTEERFSVWICSGGHRDALRIEIWDSVTKLKFRTTFATHVRLEQGTPPLLLLSPSSPFHVLAVIRHTLFLWDGVTGDLMCYASQSEGEEVGGAAIDVSSSTQNIDLEVKLPDIGISGTFVSPDRAIVIGKDKTCVRVRLVFDRVANSEEKEKKIAQVGLSHANFGEGIVTGLIVLDCTRDTPVCPCGGNGKSNFKMYFGSDLQCDAMIAISTSSGKLFLFSLPSQSFIAEASLDGPIVTLVSYLGRLWGVLSCGTIVRVCIRCAEWVAIGKSTEGKGALFAVCGGRVWAGMCVIVCKCVCECVMCVLCVCCVCELCVCMCV